MYNVVLKTYKGAREVALRLRALTVLLEDLLQAPSLQPPIAPVPGDWSPLLDSAGHCTCVQISQDT